MNEPKILLVGNRANGAKPTWHMLEEAQQNGHSTAYRLENVTTLQQALGRMGGEYWDVILLSDASVPAIRRILQVYPSQSIIALGAKEHGTEALRAGAQDYLLYEETTVALLKRSIQSAIERKKAGEALADRQIFAQATLDALMSTLSILDEKGVIISVNRAWREFAQANALDPDSVSEGVNYLAVCDSSTGENAEEAAQVAAGIRAVLSGERETFGLEYPCHSPQEKRWFICRVTRFFENSQMRVVINHENITERRLVEEKLRESEEKWRTLVNTTPDYIALHDDQGRFLFLNHFAEGFSEQDVIGSSVYKYMNPEAEALFRGQMEACMSTWKSQKFEHTAMGDLGTLRTYEEHLVPLLNKNKDTNVLVVGRDITERKQAEESIRQSEAVLRAAQRIAQMGSWRVNLSDGSIVWSEEMYRIYGVGKQTFGHTIFALFEFIYPDDRDLMNTWIELAASKKNLDAIEFRIVRPDGAIRHIIGMGEIIRDQAGQAMFLIGTAQDITERKQTEASLREANEYLENLFNYANAPIIVWDPQFKITRFNHAFEKITGRTAADVLGKPLEILFPQSEVNSSMQLIHNTQSGERWEIVEINIQHQDGSIRTVLWNSATLFSGDGISPLATIAQGQDISRRLQAESDLRQHRDHLEELVRERTSELVIAKEQAESANRAKSDFLAVMSHEIRTPLNGVMGLAHLVLQTELTARQRDYLNLLQNSGETLLATINDILDFSKIEAGKLTIEQVNFNLDDVLNQLSSLVAQRAQAKGLELIFDAGLNVPRLLVGDPLRLGQVLLNLVGNAVKFTETGEIIVKVTALQKCGERIILEFSVRDTGIGLTETQMSRLFQPFSQADSSTSRNYGGSGLGLLISQRLVNLMDGEIHAESWLGQGSLFTFTVEIEQQTGGQLVTFGATPDLDGVRVLVVEDHTATLEYLRSTLESFSFRVATAQSAESGLALMAQSGNDPFGLVLMDWHLPGGMDGLEAAKHIKQDAKFKDTPIIQLVNTDEMLMQDADQAIEGTLVKPITRSQLFDAIMQVFGHKALAITKSAKNRISTEMLEKLSGKEVLLVEDNEINQLVAREILQQMGLRVSLAANGQQAVEMAEQTGFDAILMDIQMPGIDGYQATAQIRAGANQQAAQVPIIAMTAHALNGESQKAMQAGLNDYVSKPVDVAQLANVLLRWVNHPSMLDASMKIGLDPDLDFLPDTLDSINMVEALERLGNNKKLYRRLLLLFHKDYAQVADAIHSALQENDIELAQRLSHTLKGLAGQLGADELRVAAKDLEHMIAEGNVSSYDQYMNVVDQKLAIVMAAIATKISIKAAGD
jgi:two-component system sensor histidine kinase/response regulator